MGLDVTAYRQLTLVPDAVADDDGEAPDGMWCPGNSMDWSEGLWPRRAEGIPDAHAYYSYADADGSIGYSYSTHTMFRQKLAKLVGLDARAIWDDEQQAAPGPFIELIDFADNEGVIGPVVAKKLAADFADHREAAEREFNSHAHPWLWDIYQKWQTACEMASDGGALDFH